MRWPVALDQPVLDRPVDLAVDQRQVLRSRRRPACGPTARARARSSGRRCRASATCSTARAWYSRWMSSALASRPPASRTVRRPVRSWLISRIARIGLSRREVPELDARPRSSPAPACAEPTLSSVVTSDMFESPTITCSRR